MTIITRAYHTREVEDHVFYFPSITKTILKRKTNSPIDKKCQIT